MPIKNAICKPDDMARHVINFWEQSNPDFKFIKTNFKELVLKK